MKVLIVGLGLMGGAYSYRLKDKGYEVYGNDLNIETINFAKDNNFIDFGDINPENLIYLVDVIILAIYPQSIIPFLEKYQHCFKENQIVTDICGVKSSFIAKATELVKPATYISSHPMAGREKIGIKYAKECMFEQANFLITPYGKCNDKQIDVLKQLGKDLGFKNITIIDVESHDNLIGFTSQLAHVMAVALVNSDHNENTKLFIGDSYRDLTRIAMINDTLWSELFLENKDNLFKHIQSFENELDKIKNALYNNDKEKLVELFKEATITRKGMKK